MAAAAAPLAYDDSGSGPAVVLLHGQPGSARVWARVVQHIRGTRRAIAPDRPGYGRSGGRALDFAGNARAVTALLDRLGLPSATVVGHSWGGGVALALAQLSPERVDGLVLVSSIGAPSTVARSDRLLAAPVVGPALAALGLALAGPLIKAMPRALRARLIPELGDAPRADVAELAGGWLAPSDWRSFVAEQRILVDDHDRLVAALAGVAAPAVVIEGAADRIGGPRSGRELASALPHAELVVVAGGHLVPYADPEAIAAALERLAACAPRGAARGWRGPIVDR